MTEQTDEIRQALERGRRVLAGGRLGEENREKLLFATISGAHAYGIPSADSDLDKFLARTRLARSQP